MPSERSQGIPEPDEATPLLSKGNTPPKETPLPTQVLVLLFLQLAEPITSLSIRPYVNQLVSELPIVGGDERKVGYYAGLIVSLYFAAEAVTVLQWSRLSDHVGRKPVLLFGLFGTIVSSILFGLSRSFPALVLSRCLHGALNGNIGVMKSMMAELTDETNMARAFSLVAVSWAVGGTIGPFIGGVLSRPQDRWPNVFSHPFWGEFPYFLPCLATAAYSVLAFSLAAIFLKETVNSKPVIKLNVEVNSELTSNLRRVGEGEILDGAMQDTEKPLPLRALLTRPVVVSVANSGVISLLDMAASALIPLVWSMPVEFGGLSMSPVAIGLWVAAFGSVNGIFQFVAFPPFARRFGTRRVFIVCVIFFFPIYILFPFQNLALRQSSRGGSLISLLLIALQLSVASFADMGFSAINMYISSAAPNKRSLGATNGLAQTVVSIQRMIGPAAAASLFSFSLDNNILGGNFAYIVLLFLTCAGLCVAMQLPEKMWNHIE